MAEPGKPQKLRNEKPCQFHLGMCAIGACLAPVNVYMRIVNGNTVMKKPIKFCFVNSDGVMDKTRFPAFQALQCDILAISETHLTSELQHMVRHSFSGFDAFWGAPSTGKGGVGFLVKHGSVWHAEAMTWSTQSTCHSFYQNGRLHGLTLWLGTGKYRMNCYVLYGPAGARWNDGLRQQTHSLIQAVLDDAAAQGLPAIFGGDINLGLCDSDLLQRLPQLEWTSLVDMVNLAAEPTCYKGKGSTIDFVFANPLALMAFKAFSLGSRQGLADHVPLCCEFDQGVAKQLVLRNRHYGSLPSDFDFSSIEPLPNQVCCLDPSFYSALEQHDTTTAFRLWNAFAEQHLAVFWKHFDDTDFRKGRGTIRLTSTHVWPQVRRSGPASLAVRRLWRHVCRMVEIQKRPYGCVAERTWRNAAGMTSDLPEQFRSSAQEHLTGIFTVERAAALQKILEPAIDFVQREERNKRLKQWKSRMQSSTKAVHAWIKHKAKSSSMCFADEDGIRTANVQSLFGAVRQAWQGIHELFKDGEPSWDHFIDTYGHLIDSHPVELAPLSGEMLRTECLSTAPTSPGLDLWLHSDLKLLAIYAPWVFDSLCSLLQVVESSGNWPCALIAGFTSLIPKDGVSADQPGDLRPLTVCSTIYRLWARIRARQLGTQWQELWAHSELWGGRIGRGAEPLFTAVCLDLELCPDDHQVAGLSFDLSKAFDRIPRNFLSKLLQRMSMPECVHKPYMGLLRFATRRFKLGPWLDKSQPIYGGILQGCPLSMIAINAVVNIWLCTLSSVAVSSRPRAYVDDVSVTLASRCTTELRQKIQELLDKSHGFVQAIGGKLNVDKSFSFGSSCVQGQLQPDIQHCSEFRLVGGSVTVRDFESLNATQLELKRMKAWQQTIDAARFLPISWRDRCGVLLRTRSQFTWGVGTHSLCTTRTHSDTLIKLRSSVMRCLLRREQYIASPGVYFALLTSPSICPQFCRVADGVNMLWRALCHTNRWDEVRAAFYNPEFSKCDGPVSRLRQIDAMVGFEGVISKLFSSPDLDYDQWLHDLRDTWRSSEFRRVSRDRAAFRGLEDGVCRAETLQYLHELEKDGKTDGAVSPTPFQEECRMRAAVLRLLLTGGLFTQHVISQHRQKTDTFCDCEHGGVLDIEHVSWHCRHYDRFRTRLTPEILQLVTACKPCFRYATIVTSGDVAIIPYVHQLQHMLVTIWQENIRNYLGYNDVSAPTDTGLSQTHALSAQGYIIEKGHWIDSAPGGGVYCRRCGVYVKEVRHRRLKISYRQCPFAHVPESELLDKPGFDTNPHRMASLFATLDPIAAGHDLCWDGSVACKPPVGQVRCLRCKKNWPWNNRHNLTRQPCRAGDSSERAPTPERWLSMRLLKADRISFLRHLGLPVQNDPVRRRLRCKTRIETSSSSSTSSASTLPQGNPVEPAQFDANSGPAWRLFDDMG